MMESRPDEGQHELFEEFSKQPKRAERFPSLSKSPKALLFSTTVEQLLLAGIVLILAFCFVFFLGTLRGKTLARSDGALPVSRPVAAAPKAAVAVAAAQKAPVVSAAPGQKPYTIQLVTHRKKENAENDAMVLRRSGFFSLIIPSGEYYQVCAGQYESKDAAKKDLAFFRTKYKDAFLRRS